jgi:hypothetical protein
MLPRLKFQLTFRTGSPYDATYVVRQAGRAFRDEKQAIPLCSRRLRDGSVSR